MIYKLLKPLFLIALILFMGSNSYAQRDKYSPEKAQEAIAEFQKTDKSLSRFFDSSYGYAVFPSVGKGAIGIGGASGRGVVYQGDKPTGGVNLKQVSIGFQLGGQVYREIIFFEDADTYRRFISNEFQFAAQVSAVALKSGISADARYTDGVAVFTMAKGGLMYEASVGGQRFKFIPFR